MNKNVLRKKCLNLEQLQLKKYSEKIKNKKGKIKQKELVNILFYIVFKKLDLFSYFEISFFFFYLFATRIKKNQQ